MKWGFDRLGKNYLRQLLSEKIAPPNVLTEG